MRRLLALALLCALVPLSSLLGLQRPMNDFGSEVFADVWQANLWGDLMFTLGTIGAAFGAGALVWYALRPGTPTANTVALLLASLPLSFFLQWLVYALSWSLTGNAYLDEGGFMALDFQWDNGEQSAWTFVWDWGSPGLWFAGFAAPGGATLVDILPGGGLHARMGATATPR